MDSDNFYISGNRDECCLQAGYLLIYFVCDVSMTSLLLKHKFTGKCFEISKEDKILIKNLWESKGMWPPNSPDFNPVDYAIWSAIQQRVYETRVHDIDELRVVTASAVCMAWLHWLGAVAD